MTKKIDHRQIARLSITYLATMLGVAMRMEQGDAIDVLIVMAVIAANGDKGRGISRAALSRTLNVPLETVRRHVNALVRQRRLAKQHDGLVFVYRDELSPGQETALGEMNLRELRQLFRALKENGIALD